MLEYGIDCSVSTLYMYIVSCSFLYLILSPFLECADPRLLGCGYSVGYCEYWISF